MTYYGALAAGAARKKRQQMLLAEEEEDVVEYTQDDLKNDWEFKIVRSDTAAFRKPEVLERLVEEESQAGWVMLEKLDDSRIRFKRPRTARAGDDFLLEGVDPYRTRYGVPSARYAVLASVLIGLVLLGLLVAGYLVTGGTGTPTESVAVPATLTPLIFIVLGFLGSVPQQLR